jgi:prephenate dehydrogenase
VRIAIIGMGLIGTSVALAARRAWPSLEITGIDRRQATEAAEGAETIVLAAPVDANIEILTTHGRRFASSVITDVGSSKRATIAAARAQGLSNFVGGHPMAGAASSGPADARADMFDGRPWFLFPRGADARAVARMRAFIDALRARTVLMDDDGSEHDRVMAAVSHLPQVVASSLMAVVGEATAAGGLEWAGNGLRDTTRLAAGSGEMWSSILSTNRDAIGPLLVTLADQLRTLAARLDDPEAVRAVFDAANAHRRRLVEMRSEDGPTDAR